MVSGLRTLRHRWTSGFSVAVTPPAQCRIPFPLLSGFVFAVPRGQFRRFLAGDYRGFRLEPLGLAIKGLTIVSPHKEAAFAVAASRSPMACKAGASNIFLPRGGSWEAHTTDTESVAGVMQKASTPPVPIKAAVIGCGGAGRAIAAALQHAGSARVYRQSRQGTRRTGCTASRPTFYLSFGLRPRTFFLAGECHAHRKR